jgi:hypothetical protein
MAVSFPLHEDTIQLSAQCNDLFPLSLAVSINPLTPELNPSAQRCLARFLLGILLL